VTPSVTTNLSDANAKILPCIWFEWRHGRTRWDVTSSS